MLQIEKNDPKRWFIVKKLENTGDSIKGFGNSPMGDLLSTGQPELLQYLTEEELQLEVNKISGQEEYYKLVATAEVDSQKYIGISKIYGEPNN